jgi:hypothetical protein
MEMTGMRMLVGLIAAVAVSASVVGTATAKRPSKLDLTWGASPEEFQLKAGDEFTLLTSEARIASKTGEVKCGEGGITGLDQTNDEKADKIRLTGPFGSLAGAKVCASTITPFSGEAYVYLLGDLGTLYLGANGRSEVTTEQADLQLYFLNGLARCDYIFRRLRGRVSATRTIAVIEDRFSKLALHLERVSSAPGCPRTVAVTVAFVGVTNGGSNLVFEHAH